MADKSMKKRSPRSLKAKRSWKTWDRRLRGFLVEERHLKTGKIIYHKATPDEIEMLRELEIHRIYHQFQKRVLKYAGYEAMRAAERFAKSHPSVAIVRCDDDFHASSSLVLIPHEDEKEYFGTSVAFIPQCTGEKTIIFFLYDCHLDGLLTALRLVRKRSRQGNRKQR